MRYKMIVHTFSIRLIRIQDALYLYNVFCQKLISNKSCSTLNRFKKKINYENRIPIDFLIYSTITSDMYFNEVEGV